MYYAAYTGGVELHQKAAKAKAKAKEPAAPKVKPAKPLSDTQNVASGAGSPRGANERNARAKRDVSERRLRKQM